MGLTLTDVLPDYRASLHDAASVFKGTEADADADLKRHLQIAARALAAGKRTLTRLLSIALIAGVSDYDDVVPADLVAPKASDWGINPVVPLWRQPRTPLPRPSIIGAGSDRVLVLSPAPSADQIGVFGATYRLYYMGAHQITDDAATSTLQDADKNLLLLRALIEAAREMVNRNLHKPVQMSPGTGGFPANATPAAYYEKLLAEYREAA